MGEQPKPSLRRLVLLIWLFVAVFYFALAWNYIEVTSTDKKLAEYLDYVVQLAGDQRRPAKEVRALIMHKAEELALPLNENQITVSGIGQSLDVFVDYEVNMDFPGLQRVLYKKIFQHSVKYHPPR